MYSRLPTLYRQKDAELGQTVDEVKRQLPSIDDSKVPASVRSEFQLQRFLRILGALWNALRSEVDHAMLLLDVDRAEAKWLPYLARLLGWNLNQELPVDTQRLELKNVPQLYQKRGRQEAISFLIQQLTDFSYEFRYGADRLLVTRSEDPDRQVNPASHLMLLTEAITLGQKDDLNYYIWGLRPNFALTYGEQYVYLYLTQNLLNPNATLLTNKIGRVGQEFLPWGVVLIILTDAFYGEADYATETTGDDSYFLQEETWQQDRWFWLHTWSDPATTGSEQAGTLYNAGDTSFWRTWYPFFLEENYSNPPLVESDGDPIPPPP